MAEFPVSGHVVLTVNDLSVSVPWYQKLFGGADPVIDEDTGPFRHVVWGFPNGFLVSLHGFKEFERGPFNERRVGLDHFSFHVNSRAELEEWEKKLDDMGIEHGKIVDASYGSGLAFRDPDNIQLEFFALPGT
jgi:catechol 2,3-dioxygenase-like lactoylglutathione lyase family enzyme